MLSISGEILFLLLTMVFDETFTALALASLYPLPEVTSEPHAAAAARTVPPTLITITGNDVEVQNAGGVAGTCALLFTSDVMSSEGGLDDSLIVANNRFRARTPQPDVAAAFLWYFGRCVLQGNLIADVPIGSGATSLHIFADGIDDNTAENASKANVALLSVVGNTFEGVTNLGKLVRPESVKLKVVPPLNTWVYWNANA
jgi:hypothetical protein